MLERYRTLPHQITYFERSKKRSFRGSNERVLMVMVLLLLWSTNEVIKLLVLAVKGLRIRSSVWWIGFRSHVEKSRFFFSFFFFDMLSIALVGGRKGASKSVWEAYFIYSVSAVMYDPPPSLHAWPFLPPRSSSEVNPLSSFPCLPFSSLSSFP